MRAPRLALAAAAMTAAAVFAPLPASTANTDWNNKRDAARAHATAITQAWSRLSAWIERRPRGSDADLTQVRGPHLWLRGHNSRGIRSGETFAVVTQGAPPAVPPVWNPGWTVRGLDFRFCDNVLAVYAAEPLKGADMPTIAVEGGLQIVRGSIAKGTPQSGYPTTAIPGCMSLPNGAVALVATAIDPFDWASTRRRNEHDDWQRGCPVPGGDPAATVGQVRYAQTRPIEIHPWSGADMDRWPDLCRDRPAAGGTFAYTGPVYGTVTGVLPEHGACVPYGPGIVGIHIAAAVEHDGCRRPTLIGGRRSARWHFYDQLCTEAASGATAAIDGGASAHTAAIREDGTVFLDQSDYDGNPQPTDLPVIPACPVSSYCPGPYTDGGAVGSRAKIEKHRYLWKEPNNQVLGGGTGWEPNKRRDYTEPGGAAGTGVTGVSKGDRWIRENFRGCYQRDEDICPACTCPPGQEGAEITGLPEVRIHYHVHDPRAAANPHIVRIDTCGCTACQAVDPGGDDGGHDGGHDGTSTEGGTHGDDTGTGDHSGHDNGIGW